MKSSLFLLVLGLSLFADSRPAVADLIGSSDKVIYGEDNRRSYVELSAENVSDQLLIQYGKSVLAQIPNWRIDFSNDQLLEVKTRSLEHGLNFCADERFAQSPLVSSCSAFLVGPDLLVTAGHCIKDKYECKKQTWVLDYDSAPDFISPDGSVFFPRESSYRCRELVSWSNNGRLDYALVRLDREVVDRRPLPIRRAGKLDSLESLAVIGHPLGLPKMVSDSIWIRENSLSYTFKTNADTLSGNSGSPVIGLESKLVEGVLIRGEDDFDMNYETLCQTNKKCKDKECRGETALRSNVLPLKHIPKI